MTRTGAAFYDPVSDTWHELGGVPAYEDHQAHPGRSGRSLRALFPAPPPRARVEVATALPDPEAVPVSEPT